MSAEGQISQQGCTSLSNLDLARVDTRQELADSVGLGRSTMSKVMQIDENAPEAVKQALDKGEASVNKGYEITKKLAELPEEEREAAAAEAKIAKIIREKILPADYQEPDFWAGFENEADINCAV